MTSKTCDGVTYTVSGLSTSKSEDLIGELSVKAKLKGTTLSAKLLTDSDSPAGEIKYEREDPTFNRRASITFCASGKGDKIATKADLLTSSIGLSVDADIINRCITTSATSTIAPSSFGSFVVIGAQGLFDLTEGSVSGSKVSASLFDGIQSEVNVQCTGVPNKPECIVTSYSHLVRPGFSVAGNITYKNESGSAVAAMAGALKLDGATTIKGKLESSGLTSLSYIQKVRPHTEVVLSSTFDVTKFETAKVGISVTLE